MAEKKNRPPQINNKYFSLPSFNLWHIRGWVCWIKGSDTLPYWHMTVAGMVYTNDRILKQEDI